MTVNTKTKTDFLFFNIRWIKEKINKNENKAIELLSPESKTDNSERLEINKNRTNSLLILDKLLKETQK